MPLSLVACAKCEKPFVNTRANRRFCSTACRKSAHKAEERTRNVGLARPTQIRRTFERIESMVVMRAIYLKRRHVSLEEGNRYLDDLIRDAREGNAKLREILTNPVLRSPGPGHRRRRLHRYMRFPTLGDYADEYTWETWGCSVIDAVRDDPKEPPVSRRDLPCLGQILPARAAPQRTADRGTSSALLE